MKNLLALSVSTIDKGLVVNSEVQKNKVPDLKKPNCKLCQSGIAILSKWNPEEKIDKRTKASKLLWFCTKKNCYIHKKNLNTCMFNCWSPMVKTDQKC